MAPPPMASAAGEHSSADPSTTPALAAGREAITCRSLDLTSRRRRPGTTLAWNVVIAGSLTDALVDLELIETDASLLTWCSIS